MGRVVLSFEAPLEKKRGRSVVGRVPLDQYGFYLPRWVVPLRELAVGRSHTGRLRVAAVRDTSLPMTERLRAAEQLENRGMGKPKETVEHQSEDNPLRDELLRIPPEERRAWLRDLNARKAAEH
jgi:hypothetical protein